MFGLDNEATNHLFLFLLLWSLVGGVCVIEGRRRGVSASVAILGSFPMWVALFAVWLLRQPIIRKD